MITSRVSLYDGNPTKGPASDSDITTFRRSHMQLFCSVKKEETDRDSQVDFTSEFEALMWDSVVGHQG